MLQRHVTTVTDPVRLVSGYVMHDMRLWPDGTWQLHMHKPIDWLCDQHLAAGDRAVAQNETIRGLVALSASAELSRDLQERIPKKRSPFRDQLRCHEGACTVEERAQIEDEFFDLSPGTKELVDNLIVSPPVRPGAKRRISLSHE